MVMTNKLNKDLEQVAKMIGATKDIVLENAVQYYLAYLQDKTEYVEDIEDARRVEKAWNDFEKTYTIAEVRNEFKL